MVNRQARIGPAAILAPVPITAQNILPREDNFLVGNLDVDTEADDAGEGHRSRDRPDALGFVRLDQFGFTKPKEDDRFFDIADAHRLVVLVEDEHLAA